MDVELRVGLRAGGVILAAGAGSRFGGDKLLADLDGKPLVQHVVDAAAAAGLDPIVVVEPPLGALAGLDFEPARRVVNPMPEEGLSSSVRLGLRALGADPSDVPDAAVILPADQPRVRSATISTLLKAAAERPATPFVVARHAADGSPNPVLVRRSMWRLADELVGDRGFGPILATHTELVREVLIEGSNPDVDTRDDLDRLASDNAGSHAPGGGRAAQAGPARGDVS